MSQKYQEYNRLDLPNVAEEVLRKWKANGVFEASVSSREGKNRSFSSKDRLRLTDCLVFTT